LSIIDRIDQNNANLIDRDFTYITYALAIALVAFVIGILAGMVLEPVLGSNGNGFRAGIWIALAGAILSIGIVAIVALKLFLDTWKIEATPELRAKYGKSIKWAILFFFMLFPTWLWALLIIGYFAYQGRYNRYRARRANKSR
jgi:MFS family permease